MKKIDIDLSVGYVLVKTPYKASIGLSIKDLKASYTEITMEVFR